MPATELMNSSNEPRSIECNSAKQGDDKRTLRTDRDVEHIDGASGDPRNRNVTNKRQYISRITALALGLVTLVAITSGVYFFMDQNDYTMTKKSSLSANFQGSVTPAALKEHQVAEDCWLALHGKVCFTYVCRASEHHGFSAPQEIMAALSKVINSVLSSYQLCKRCTI